MMHFIHMALYQAKQGIYIDAKKGKIAYIDFEREIQMYLDFLRISIERIGEITGYLRAILCVKDKR